MSALHDRAGAAIAGVLLMGIPTADILLGSAFNGVHAVLGMMGLAFLVVTLPDREA